MSEILQVRKMLHIYPMILRFAKAIFMGLWPPKHPEILTALELPRLDLQYQGVHIVPFASQMLLDCLKRRLAFFLDI